MSATPAPLLALGITLAVLVAQRLAELVISARHERKLVARGAVEFGRGHFAGFVVLHALLPLALVGEVVLAGARPPAFWPALLVPLAGAEALRYLAMRALCERWHVRVWVVPGQTPIRRGIYRWIAHPNYLAVAIELVTLPALFGAWRTLIGATVANAILLAMRIPAETRALRWAAESGAEATGGP